MTTRDGGTFEIADLERALSVAAENEAMLDEIVRIYEWGHDDDHSARRSYEGIAKRIIKARSVRVALPEAPR